jgi:hypothetical protein
MSDAIPIAAFADARTSLWGVLLGGAAPLFACAHLRSGESLRSASATMQGAGSEQQQPPAEGAVWEMRTADSALSVSPTPSGARSGPADSSPELCEFRGSAATADGKHELECAGVRVVTEIGRLESLRLVAAWFPEGNSVALLALRPTGARGHADDRVAAAVAGVGEGLSIFDPRLSTTYRGDGSPLRVGVELWLGESEDSELQLRRFAGDAEPTAGSLSRDGLTIDCQTLAAHDTSASGPGVYLLARVR